MLLSLGRHGDLMQRLHGAFWRAMFYPVTILTALLALLAFIWFWIIPRLPGSMHITFVRFFGHRYFNGILRASIPATRSCCKSPSSSAYSSWSASRCCCSVS